MRTPFARPLTALLLAAGTLPAHAHTDLNAAIPESPGAWIGAAAAGAWTSASDPLPSQRLPGYLLLGDPGIDRRGARLEHAVLQFGYRFDETFGAHLALGLHDGDPVHVESAWLQARGSHAGIGWTLGAGRERPPLGPVMTYAGHFDAFGAMPLAKAAVTNGDWISDGVRLGAEGAWHDIGWTLDLGLWAGQTFPGARPGAASPSMHGGVEWDALGGEWSFDGFVALLDPAGRGSRVVAADIGHSHEAPRCDASLADVVCFEGRSLIRGLSVRWEGRGLPIGLAAAVMWRDEDGTLQSRNGRGAYDSSNRGDWVQALWRPAAGWEAGVRHERLAAAQTLVGPGANLLAAEAGLIAYRPQQRTTAMLGYLPTSWAELRLEAGEERAGERLSRFVSFRLIARWGERL
jgi:hypothetical protein